MDAATRRKAVVAATVGNFVQWYAFTIYGYFATVIAALFFSSEDPLTSILATFAIFGVAFLVRPVGALVIGRIGDRIGHRVTLSGVILLMSGATFLIGLYLRLRLEDTPHFRAVREAAEVESAPLRDALSSHGRDILRVIGCIVFGTALTYLLIHLPTYMTTIVGFEQTHLRRLRTPDLYLPPPAHRQPHLARLLSHPGRNHLHRHRPYDARDRRRSAEGRVIVHAAPPRLIDDSPPLSQVITAGRNLAAEASSSHAALPCAEGYPGTPSRWLYTSKSLVRRLSRV